MGTLEYCVPRIAGALSSFSSARYLQFKHKPKLCNLHRLAMAFRNKLKRET